jgi:hypothetical protein
MQPIGVRVTRRGRRRAWKGHPAGRRATHTVQTTYGKHQRNRPWQGRPAAVAASGTGHEEGQTA